MEAVIVKKIEPELKIKEIADVVKSRVCGWAPPSFGDVGQTALHTILAAVAFATALWNAYEQLRIFRMRHRLADAYAAMAEGDCNRFNERYRPLEDQMIKECLAEGPH